MSDTNDNNKGHPLIAAAAACDAESILRLVKEQATVRALSDRVLCSEVAMALVRSAAADDLVREMIRHVASTSEFTGRMVESYAALCCFERKTRRDLAVRLVREARFVSVPVFLVAVQRNLTGAIEASQTDGRIRVHPNDRASLHHKALCLAAKYNRVAVIRLLARDGARVDVSPPGTGLQPLQVASDLGHVEAVRVLCELGASLTDRTQHGSTALHLASIHGHTGVMRVLLEHGANKEARKRTGMTPIISAASCDNGGSGVDACRMLVEAGAEVNACTSDGLTAMHVAAHRGDCELIAYLASVGASIQAEKVNGMTPLHSAACDTPHAGACELLLRLGARPDATYGGGNTAMHVAALCGGADAIAVMLRGGCDVALRNGVGQLALHHAARKRSTEICEMLLRAGSPVDAPDTNGLSAAVIAAMVDGTETLRVLYRHGASGVTRMFHTGGEERVSALSLGTGEALELARRWAAGEDHEQVAARTVRDMTDRRMLPELADICAAYLVVPVPREAAARGGEPDAKRQRRL